MSTKITGIYDARKELGWGKSIIMGLQQCFAMFGATILVPVLTNSYGEGIVGLSASVTLFCAGIATLWFHFITKGKVPVFLGSSFAFLGMYSAIIPAYGKEYATGGVVAAGGLYVILAILIKVLGTKRVMKLCAARSSSSSVLTWLLPQLITCSPTGSSVLFRFS